MKSILKLVIVIITTVLFFGSCSNKECNCDINSNSNIQKFDTPDYIILLNSIDHGSFGITCKMRICDKKNNLKEEIDLRGDDSFPKLDSVVNKNIYVSYVYRTSNQEKLPFKIPFENIVLGDGLLNKDNLEFKYFFFGKYVE